MKYCAFLILAVVFVKSSFLLAAEPIRNVIFTMKYNEILSSDECTTNMKIQNMKFVLLVTDTLKNTQTFVWNGIRKVTADWIHVMDIDFNNYDKNTIIYKRGNGRYIHILGQERGPYEWVGTGSRQYIYDVWWKPYTNTYYNYNRNKYYFDLMGTEYVHDYDGTIYKISEGRYKYVSLNKKHIATISQDRRVITIDMHPYVLPIGVDYKIVENPVVCLFDDGTCYYQQSVVDDFSKSYKQTKLFEFYITQKEIKKLTSDQSFNFETQQIVNNVDVNTEDFMPLFCSKFGWKMLEEVNEWIIPYEFSIQDKNKKHFFSANWAYPYVLIDGKKYGNACPIYAYYDDIQNAFAWIVIEKNNVVFYSYQL